MAQNQTYKNNRASGRDVEAQGREATRRESNSYCSVPVPCAGRRTSRLRPSLIWLFAFPGLKLLYSSTPRLTTLSACTPWTSHHLTGSIKPSSSRGFPGDPWRPVVKMQPRRGFAGHPCSLRAVSSGTLAGACRSSAQAPSSSPPSSSPGLLLRTSLRKMQTQDSANPPRHRLRLALASRKRGPLQGRCRAARYLLGRRQLRSAHWFVGSIRRPCCPCRHAEPRDRPPSSASKPTSSYPQKRRLPTLHRYSFEASYRAAASVSSTRQRAAGRMSRTK
ncbi:hypothetical protein L1887_48089 [Cichorium endivia]|nr:hypothetical protein L1887_48089 [Cichorium endivia]